jgi:hypothetical protein
MISVPIYQVIILGGGAEKNGRILRAQLMVRIRELGRVVASAVKFLQVSEVVTRDRTAPTVAVYLGADNHTDAAVAASLISDAVPILPVVSNLGRFSFETPPALRHVNGIELGGSPPNFSEVINFILESLTLLRKTRRLFLSYRRKDSARVAEQLRNSFDKEGYDAFLDTSSVPKGDDFQAVLWHRMLDSDVMVVLNTPDFLASKWTKEELAHASAMSVGILDVRWPGVAALPHAALAQVLHLDLAEITKGGRLTRACRHLMDSLG